MLPDTIQFSIADDIYVAADPTTTPPVAEERYGDAFAGTITCRIPTVIEKMLRLPNETVALLEAQGAKDATAAVLSSWEFATALTFFTVLGRDLPPWLVGTSLATPKMVTAIRHAHQRALGEIEEQKKSSEPAGVTSSAAT